MFAIVWAEQTMGIINSSDSQTVLCPACPAMPCPVLHNVSEAVPVYLRDAFDRKMAQRLAKQCETINKKGCLLCG